MKKNLPVALCLMHLFIMSAHALSLSPIVGTQTKSECVATCNNSHCCTEGVNTTIQKCPDGWTLSSGTCVRASTTTYSEEMHRYTTTNYSSCNATSETFQPWTCTNYSTSSTGWTECCVIQSDGTCQTIQLM